MRRSRLKRHLQEQSLRNILLAIGGIIVIIVLLAIFGMDILINMSLLVKRSAGGNDTKKNDLSYVAPPVLTPMSEATKSATITVSGYAGAEQTIKLYVNGKMVDTVDVDRDKQFTFSDIKLEKGTNEIKAKSITNDEKESNYSPILKISYISEPPSLEVSSPQDGQTVSRGDGPLKIRGKTDEAVKVTVNDFWAIVQDDGEFSYSLSLQEGDNTIKVVATDDAGNQTTKELKIKAN